MPFPHVDAVHGLPGVEHLKPTSSLQVELQPSPFVALPSSHCSPTSTTEFPQTGTTTATQAGAMGVGGTSLKTMQPGLHGLVVHPAEVERESVESEPSWRADESRFGVYARVETVPPSAPHAPHVPFVHVCVELKQSTYPACCAMIA